MVKAWQGTLGSHIIRRILHFTLHNSDSTSMASCYFAFLGSSLLQRAHNSPFLAKSLEFDPCLLERHHNSLVLRRRVVAVTDVDGARLLLLGTNNYRRA